MSGRGAGPVVRVIGGDVPRQLLLAAGAQPVRLTGAWTGEPDDEAARLLGAADAEAVHVLRQVLDEPDDESLLVVCNDSQAHLRVFYVLRVLLPGRVHLLDLPRVDSPAARTFARSAFRRLWDAVVAAVGSPDPGSVARAEGQEAEVAAARERLARRRRADPPECTGAAALDALLAAARSAPEDAVRTLDAADGRSDVHAAPVVRVHVTGSTHPDSQVYRELEAAGFVVVGEDHGTGDDAWHPVVGGAHDVDALLNGLVSAHFARVFPSSVELSRRRAEHTAASALAAGAGAVAALIREADDAPEWDVREQRALLAGAGIPLAVRSQVPADGALAAARELARDVLGARS